MILAVVSKRDGVADGLTAERLELDPNHLCLGVESKEEKTLLERLITPLRDEARKVRAN